MIQRAGRALSDEVYNITGKVYSRGLKLAESGKLKFIDIDGIITQWTQAPRGAVYTPYSHPKFASLLELNNFNSEAACDLGSGLGGMCAVEKLFFKRVEGWELDPDLFAESSRMWKDEGAPYDEIKFHNLDFLGHSANLSEFSFIYFFYPFMDNFKALMGQKLLGARKGAVIACPEFYDKSYEPSLFPKDHFSKFPLVGAELEPDGYFPFYVYVRA